MPSERSYCDFILEQFAGLREVRARAMMGEYLLYDGDKLVGGIYDNRLLVKPTPSAIALMPFAAREIPYSGAKEMLLVDCADDREFLTELFAAVASDLSMRDGKAKKGK